MPIAAYARILTAFAAIAVAYPAGFAVAQTTETAIRITPFQQTIAETAAADRDLAAFYRASDFAPIWTGQGEPFLSRRQALFNILGKADDHGLPGVSYNVSGLKAEMRNARTASDLAKLDVRLSQFFIEFGTDLQTGVLTPARIDSGIVRKVPIRDRVSYLTGITSNDPMGFVESLAPQRPEYTRLMREKLRLESLISVGGFGPVVRTDSLKPGQSGNDVISLRNRLMAMGYLPRRVDATYDTEMEGAVLQFQIDHGLPEDGIAGAATIAEINTPAEDRLKSVIVAMERERWINRDLGERHVLVNLTDFHARIIDNDKVYFKTRSVIGKNISTHRTPEFSDVMEHMIINPTWNVPRSIAVREYLPAFKRNAHSNGHLKLINARGQVVDRSSVNFAAYNERNFPFDIKQPPSSRNALGLVKFMFPNVHNIYLHDTPAKSLFARDMRAFSHGCIRLREPFEFAYALLGWQTDDPEGYFKSRLNTGRETRVDLAAPLPVHLIYRTAMSQPKGHMTYRRDVYERDAKIWNALAREGVELRGVQG